MPLVVEDGTGRSDAESYQSVASFKSYCDARGYSYAGVADAKIEQSLRLSTGYIDTQFRYKGERSLGSQSLEFPRTNLTDWSSYVITGVPNRVAQACNELAFKALTQPLYEDLDRGGKVRSESVGSISVTYADDAPAGKTYQFAAKLLAQYVRDPMDIEGPFFGGGTAGYFGHGMHDNPGEGY
jgi:hypothetical protein